MALFSRDTLFKGSRLLIASLWMVFASAVAAGQAGAAGLPIWVRTPPQDTMLAIYGVGEGPTLNEATQQALRAIAGKLSTHIRSDAVSQSGLAGGVATRRYQETVEAYIQDIKLSAYDVRRTELAGGRYFVLVEMSRADFVRDTKLQLDTIDAELRRTLGPNAATRPFDRFLACQAAPATIEQGRLLALILSTTDPDFAAAGPLQQYDAYQQHCAQALQGVTLRLQVDPGFTPLAEAISRQLTVRTVSHGSADGRLDVTGNIANREMFGSKNAMVDLSVALIDDRDAVVARQTYRLNGVSVISFDAALNDALRKFLADEGVERILTDLRLR